MMIDGQMGMETMQLHKGELIKRRKKVISKKEMDSGFRWNQKVFRMCNIFDPHKCVF